MQLADAMTKAIREKRQLDTIATDMEWDEHVKQKRAKAWENKRRDGEKVSRLERRWN